MSAQRLLKSTHDSEAVGTPYLRLADRLLRAMPVSHLTAENKPMSCHPADLSLDAILNMDRERLVETLREFGEQCGVRFSSPALEILDLAELRQLLRTVRRHYHAKGY
jgi:hypothetical protein